MTNSGTSESIIDKLQDPSLRDIVVQQYKEAGLGGERYGVVCPNKECYKRICLQGLAFAMEYPEKYCLCHENYEDAPNITKVLNEHGLPWRPLMIKVDMKEATVKKGKKSGNSSKPH